MDENKIRDAADAAKGLVLAVPVYQDVVQPAAREVGAALHDVIRLALAPLKTLVWGYDAIGEYLEQALAERLKRIPPDRITTPSPAVAGPALEAMRYAGSDPELRELFANLLAKAMDARTAREAHPAFVEILKQVTPDEARLLNVLATGESFPLVTVLSELPDKSMYTLKLRHFSLLGEQAGCAYPDATPTYLDNLCRLGIAAIDEGKMLSEEREYEPLEAHAKVQEAMKQAGDEGRTGVLSREVILVSALGRQFLKIVIGES